MYNYPPPPPPGYPPYGYPPQGPKKRLVWPWVLAVSVILVGVLVLVFFNLYNRDNWERAHRKRTLTYQVEGTASALSISYTVPDGSDGEDRNPALPWSKDVTNFGRNVLIARVWATSYDSGATLTCRILSDGKKVTEQTSSGAVASVNCVADTGNKLQIGMPATRR
ncbi:hypothetical protein A5635_18265 [Mycobacterium asiaticum]|uniref:Uncharacterized protein n=2 Tax=Mycobacterium asiaticum TaxID=1790 RepID=A0A1A3NT70_MYCAS|nr:MmpS family transport accessory protein [Mycobacterium asiaticum]OBK24239.1 hypothetical protein A5635_18265 [Mycobacterium asiaticum]OBK95888.1 hypothetical protein A5645_11805 [Mycobacterium asiaticum]